jgi:hypothetical protein
MNMVCGSCLKIRHLELCGFSSEIFLSPEDYRKGDLINRRCYCTRDYTIEGSLTGAQKVSGQPHLVESLQKKEVEGAASINEYSIELNVLYDGADYKGIPLLVLIKH